MALLHARTPLAPSERLAKRRLVLQDTLALLGLFVITAVLAAITYIMFQSYSQHQRDAAARWLRRGESALNAGQPEQAIYALRSALGYAPGDRRTEIELAEALAEAGHIQEATAYFRALWEATPGDGLINLQLARLSLASHRVGQALEYYHAAIFGTWQGDGAVRRRAVRLEMVRKLIELGRFNEARNELLIAAGNANDTDVTDRLAIADLLLEAHAPTDALRLYKEIAMQRPGHFTGLEGAGRTAFSLGRYQEAEHYLQRAVALAPQTTDAAVRSRLAEDRLELEQSARLMQLYPAPTLTAASRAQRVLEDRAIAKKRLEICLAQSGNAQSGSLGSTASAGTAPTPREQAAESSPNAPQNTTPHIATSTAPSASGALSRQQPPSGSTGKAAAPESSPPPSSPIAGPLQALAARWTAGPQRLTLTQLLQDPTLEAAQIQLIYDTEITTAAACGAPSGDDALLLRIAQSPDTIQQQ